MNLDDLNPKILADRGAWLDLVHPKTGEKLGARIKILGAAGEKYQRLLLGYEDPDASIEQAHISGSEFLSEITLGWDDLQMDGKDFEYSLENARKMYLDFDWISEQVLDGSHDKSIFF